MNSSTVGTRLRIIAAGGAVRRHRLPPRRTGVIRRRHDVDHAFAHGSTIAGTVGANNAEQRTAA
jgi:hypothetical protein